jgi:cytidine deaminase
MEVKNLQISYTVCTKEQLSANEQQLINEALLAREKAYAPYSNFYVGAAVKLNNGKIITGNNQENASYPAGVCAERVALMYANAQFPGEKVKAIAICGGRDKKLSKRALTPCGICRQTILETENNGGEPIKIYLIGENEIVVFDSIEQLLPFSFKSSDLHHD